MNEESPYLRWRVRPAHRTQVCLCQDQPAVQKGSSLPMKSIVARHSYRRLSPVECAVDYIHLLLASQAHKVHRVPGDANRKMRILLRMFHRVKKRIAIKHIYIHVIASHAKECIEHVTKICHSVFHNPTKTLRDKRRSERNSVSCIAIGNLGDRRRRGVDAMLITAMHRICPRCEWLALPASIRCIARALSVDHV